MTRRVWAGIAAGVLAALVVLGVAGAAFRAGEHHQVVTTTVSGGDAVRVVGDYGWGYGHGGGFFFLFPLLLLVLLGLLLFRRARWGYAGRYDGGGGGWGGCGPGREPGGGFDERHRRAHEESATGPVERGEA